MGTMGEIPHPFVLRFTITWGGEGGKGGGGGKEGEGGGRGRGRKEREGEGEGGGGEVIRLSLYRNTRIQYHCLLNIHFWA